MSEQYTSHNWPYLCSGCGSHFHGITESQAQEASKVAAETFNNPTNNVTDLTIPVMGGCCGKGVVSIRYKIYGETHSDQMYLYEISSLKPEPEEPEEEIALDLELVRNLDVNFSDRLNAIVDRLQRIEENTNKRITDIENGVGH
jgi:hypothetical protein